MELITLHGAVSTGRDPTHSQTALSSPPTTNVGEFSGCSLLGPEVSRLHLLALVHWQLCHCCSCSGYPSALLSDLKSNSSIGGLRASRVATVSQVKKWASGV